MWSCHRGSSLHPLPQTPIPKRQQDWLHLRTAPPAILLCWVLLNAASFLCLSNGAVMPVAGGCCQRSASAIVCLLWMRRFNWPRSKLECSLGTVGIPHFPLLFLFLQVTLCLWGRRETWASVLALHWSLALMSCYEAGATNLDQWTSQWSWWGVFNKTMLF